MASPVLQAGEVCVYTISAGLFYSCLVDVYTFYFRFREALHQHPGYQPGTRADIENPYSPPLWGGIGWGYCPAP